MRPVLLTSWDDGSATDLRLAELLARYEFRGTFFATARPPITVPASDDDLRAIVRLGHEIGNHGATHRPFTGLTDAEILEEARRGMLRAQEFSRNIAAVVAPPNGKIDGRVANVLAHCGYRIRTAPIVARRLPRPNTVEPTCQVYPHGRAKTLLHIAKRHALSERAVGVRWFLSRSIFDCIERLIDVFARGPLPLHVWGHSEEIERLRYWEELERVLARARERGYVGMTIGAYLGEFDSAERLESR